MSEIKACILRAGGTNCDRETKRALNDFEDVDSEIIRINQFNNSKNLSKYDCLIIPGGFSYGDHVRAGAVFANKIKNVFEEKLEKFAEKEGAILGICNGFQVLIETGLLPGIEGISEFPKAALAINESAKYECRWIHFKNENKGNCIFSREIEKGRKLHIPIGHKEGRFILKRKKRDEILKKLYENDQIVFRYCDKKGNYAEREYPENPNGSFHDIAGVCDPKGKIFGLMPHPERAFFGYHLPNWTGMENVPEYGEGRLIFKSLINSLR